MIGPISPNKIDVNCHHASGPNGCLFIECINFGDVVFQVKSGMRCGEHHSNTMQRYTSQVDQGMMKTNTFKQNKSIHNEW